MLLLTHLTILKEKARGMLCSTAPLRAVHRAQVILESTAEG